MVSPISKKVDDLAAQIRVHQAELDQLEEQYYAQRRENDEAYLDLEDLKRTLERFYEERQDEVFSVFRAAEATDEFAFGAFRGLIEAYADATEKTYKQHYRRLDDRQDEQTAAYHRACAPIEDKIEACKKERRRLIWQ